MNEPPQFLREGIELRTLFARNADPYAGADLQTVRRLAGVLWLISLTIAIAITPIAPPTDRIGELGWAVVAALAVLSLIAAWSQLRPGASDDPRRGLAKSYGGLFCVLCFVWLAGVHHSPYEELYLVWSCVVAVSHPPRQVLAYLAAVFALSWTPLLIDGMSAVAAADTLVRLAIGSAIALLGSYWMANVRCQRVRQQMQSEHALRLARADQLTGLPNRRAFDEALELELARARRSETPISMIVLDLDAFKAVNDRYGHLEGDRMLRQAAAALRATLRRGEACYRWGGDEFALILPGSDHAEAAVAGERIAEVVRATSIRPDGHPITISWGCAELLPDMSADELLAAADLEMMARKSGRVMRLEGTEADAA